MTIGPDGPIVEVPRLGADEVARLRVTVWRVLRSEWKKFVSLRSSWFAVGLAAVFMFGIGVSIAWSTANDWFQMRPRRRMRFDPLDAPLSGFNMAQLAIGTLSILFIAGEYSTGMIRASMGAVPTRLAVLWSKLVVVCTATLVVMVPTAVITFLTAQHLLSAVYIDVSWSTSGAPRTVLGTGLYLTVVAAFALGIGAIVRNVAGAIATLVGVLVVLPVVALALPDTWFQRVYEWLPSTAGQALMGFGLAQPALSPWRGMLVFVAYALGTLVVAAVLLRRRDV